jgi:GNAT superfamily N-acetyltransferase
MSNECATRVSLRRFRGNDADAVQPWLAEAFAALTGERTARAAPLTLPRLLTAAAECWPGAEPLAVVEDAVTIGFLIARCDADGLSRETAIVALAVRADRRNLGYGGEAVAALEAARPDDRFVAAIPRTNGLAVYFWLRTGYRPIRVHEDPRRARDRDTLWMMRGSPSS